ncbi:MAG: hypothetical protein ACE5HD_02250 [Acidobacteriota bacterium]
MIHKTLLQTSLIVPLLILPSAGCGPADEPTAADAPETPSTASAAPARSAPAPRPAPAPPPRPAIYTLASGTEFTVSLDQELSSEIVSPGQQVIGRVESPVKVRGKIVIPAGTQVLGTVEEVKPAKRFGGQAMLSVRYTAVVMPSGNKVEVDGLLSTYARKETKKDAGIIAGAAAGGAILGKVLGDGGKDTRMGAAIGGGIGTAVASKKGEEAYLPAGSETTVITLREARLQSS